MHAVPFRQNGTSIKQYSLTFSLSCLFQQPPFENPEWFYRHVEMHSLLIDVPAGDCEFPVRCGWKGISGNTLVSQD